MDAIRHCDRGILPDCLHFSCNSGFPQEKQEGQDADQSKRMHATHDTQHWADRRITCWGPELQDSRAFAPSPVVYRSGVIWASLRSTQITPLLNNLLTIGIRPLMIVSHSFNIKLNQLF